jgi:hypothetical protein
MNETKVDQRRPRGKYIGSQAFASRTLFNFRLLDSEHGRVILRISSPLHGTASHRKVGVVGMPEVAASKRESPVCHLPSVFLLRKGSSMLIYSSTTGSHIRSRVSQVSQQVSYHPR